MKICENCKKSIWWWSDWRNKGCIIIDKRHSKYMLTIYFCSEKCYLDYSKRYKWLVKLNKKDRLSLLKSMEILKK